MLVAMIYLLLGVLLVVVQTSMLQLLPGNFARPDIIFLLVAFSAYKLPWIPGVFLSFSLGWMLDVLVAANLGYYPFIFLAVFVILKTITVNSPVKESAYQIPMVGVSYFLLQIGLYFFATISAAHAIPDWSWGQVVQDTLLLILAAIPFFLVFNSLYEHLQMRSARSRRLKNRTRNPL